MKCAAPRCDDDADAVVSLPDCIAAVCQVHADAAQLFHPEVRVRRLPARRRRQANSA